MNKATVQKKQYRYIGITTALLFMLVLTMKAWSIGVPDNQEERVKTENRTASFEVTIAKNTRQTLSLALKNGYKKNITAFSIQVGNSLKITEDLTIGDKMIVPGENHQIDIAPPESFRDKLQRSSKKADIKILAVVFEDGTSDGDIAEAKAIKDKWLGRNIQMKRIKGLLEDFLLTSTTDAMKDLSDLKERIRSLPEAPENDQSFDIQIGLHNAKEAVIHEIDEIEPISHHALSQEDLIKSLKEKIAEIGLGNERFINRD